MNIITPPYLKRGDKVGLVSTARKITEKEISFAVKQLEDWGLEPVLGKTIGISEDQFAGDDWTRARDFRHMLENTNIKAVFTARGGYGTLRIIDKIDFAVFKKNPKWIIGFSDLTVLHGHIHTQFGVETIHGPMLFNFKDSTKEALNSMQNALFGNRVEHTCSGHELNISGKVKAQVIGGNLSVLYSISNSRSDISTKGKILFIEDVDEYLYHIDRMIVNLKRSYKLKGLAGMIVGGFTKMRDNEIPFGKNAYEIIHEHVKNYDFPVAFGFPAGHIDDNRALIFGREAELNVDSKKCTLKFSK